MEPPVAGHAHPLVQTRGEKWPRLLRDRRHQRARLALVVINLQQRTSATREIPWDVEERPAWRTGRTVAATPAHGPWCVAGKLGHLDGTPCGR